MFSFKVKLVLWFALLALLPLAVAFYGYDTLAKRSESRRVDAGLEAGLRAAVAAYGTRLDAASRSAQQRASDPALQRALRDGDRKTLARILDRVPGAHLGDGPASVTVFDNGVVLGRVSVSIPVDARLLRSLAGGLSDGDRLVAVRDGRIVAGGSGRLTLAPERSARVRLGEKQYRGLSTQTLPEPRGLSLVALAPQQGIDAAVRASERRIISALLASLILIGIVTYLLGRSIVRTLRSFADAANAIAFGRLGERVEVSGSDEFAELGNAFNRMAAQLESRLAELETERNRVRDATARFGEALVATHDPAQLMRIVVESAVEATGAAGGVVFGRNGELARAGDPDAGSERLAFPLRVGTSDFGSLVLASENFGADQVETAASLAAQVVVALENARLHRMVERQALVDSLTGLANRRSLEESLRSELARAARFGDSVCVVLADLDDFKQVNDRYGHAAGDEVLKAFASALRATVRESDVAGRWGGEEFALVLSGTDAPGGARLAERARAAIAARQVPMPNGDLCSVTASFGVAAFPDSRELGDILAAADSALYAAKDAGKNRVVTATRSITT
ncbi:MAG: diguanylate cyclase [Thermoleophilia bacterium]|nr:diguanylate cyclase [Thermoleophilia bacterium]